MDRRSNERVQEIDRLQLEGHILECLKAMLEGRKPPSRESMQFAAALVKDGRVVSTAQNDRGLHAERGAVQNANKAKGVDVRGADVYVMGRFHDRTYFARKKPLFTCETCSEFLIKEGIGRVWLWVVVDNHEQWASLTPESCLTGLKAYKDRGITEKKLRLWLGCKISELGLEE